MREAGRAPVWLTLGTFVPIIARTPAGLVSRLLGRHAISIVAMSRLVINQSDCRYRLERWFVKKAPTAGGWGRRRLRSRQGVPDRIMQSHNVPDIKNVPVREGSA